MVSLLVACVAWAGAAAQGLPLLHIRTSIDGPDGRSIPVARHTLLISDVPVTAAPRVVVTSLDGSADVRLPAGTYIVESDRPFVLAGRSYEWAQRVTVAPGREASLVLTSGNATISAAAAGLTRELPAAVSPAPAAWPGESILASWQASAFGIWTAHAHVTGFLVDSIGLVATSRRAIGGAASVEVQISSTVKVAGAVVADDVQRDVAIVRVHASAIDRVRPIPLNCGSGPREPRPADEGRFVLEAPLFGPVDISPSLGGAPGGPVFGDGGRVIGLASPADASSAPSQAGEGLVGSYTICQAMAAATDRLDRASVGAARLPIEPPAVGRATGTRAAAGAAFSLTPYQLSTADFDLTFLTPALMAAAEGRRGYTGVRAGELSGLRVATEFGPWSEYVRQAPPLLYVRATPRLVEGFWMKMARGAASLQGAQIPPIKRLRPGFSRMRLLCGTREVTPVHPFRIQTPVTDAEAIEEGFYVFDPAVIGPACGTVSVTLSSVKDPDRTETRTVDPAIVRRVADDFGPLTVR